MSARQDGAESRYPTGIGDMAIMTHGEAARIEIGIKRLHIARHCAAAGGIADMSDCRSSLEAFDNGLRGKMVSDQPKTAFRVEALAVENHYAGRLLPTMLQGMQPERRQGPRILVAENPENPTLLVKPVFIRIERKSHQFTSNHARQSRHGNLLCHLVHLPS